MFMLSMFEIFLAGFPKTKVGIVMKKLLWGITDLFCHIIKHTVKSFVCVNNNLFPVSINNSNKASQCRKL